MTATIKFEDLPPAGQRYVRLRAATDPVEAFNLFIESWVAPASQGHLLDNDNNDAEVVRQAIRRDSEALTETLARIHDALVDYRDALERREHGGVAANRFIDAVAELLK